VCSYRDRRQGRCQTQWCPDHYHLVAGTPYCRRHHAVATALLAYDEGVATAPDIGNRAPSLCEWVANTIDADVRALLTEVAEKQPALIIQADPLSLLLEGTPRARYWERSWKLMDNLGTVVKLVLRVAEESDREVLVMVGREIVAATVPPWVDRDGSNPESRAEFHERLVRGFGRGLDNYLSLNSAALADRLGGT
jgi:hypothetical protein